MLALLLATSVALGAAPVPAELKQLQESLRHTTAVSARFTQTRRWSALKEPLVTEGQLEYRRGGKLVWRTAPPAASELVMEGKTAVLAYPALGTRQSIDFAAEPGIGRVFESIRAVLQADLDPLLPLFELAVVHKTPLTLALKPKTPELAKTLKGIGLSFDTQHRLVGVSLDETNGDTTRIALRDHVVETDGR